MARTIHASSAALLVRPALRGDGYSVASRLRVEDRNEIQASRGVIDVGGLLESAIASEELANVAVDSTGAPMILAGASVYPSTDTASLWLVACEGIEPYSRWIARQSRPWIAAILTALGVSFGHNYVDERNALHIRWLKWCGAEFTGVTQKRADPNTNFLEFYLPCAIPSPLQP